MPAKGHCLYARIRETQEEQTAGEESLGVLCDECFTATAAYGTSTAAETDVLRGFRDDVLMHGLAGFFHAASPPQVDLIARRQSLRTVVREWVVDPIVLATYRFQLLWLLA